MEQVWYYAIIPADVRYAKIKANAKLLYWEITALSNKTWECFASNWYFAQLYDVSEKQVSLWIKELYENWFISVRIDKDQGNKRFIGIHQKVNTYTPKGKEGIHQKVIHNNTYNNKDNKTNNLSIDKSIDTKPEGFEEIEYIPLEITKKIDNVIATIKRECQKNWILYASGKKERNYAKHLLSEKFGTEALQPLNISLDKFIERVIKASVDLKYSKKINNSVTLYYNRSDVVNRAIQEKTKSESQSTSKTYVIR